MDFSLSDDLLELKERTERLVREEIIPLETDPRQTPHGPAPELRRELVAIGRRAGLLSPHVGARVGRARPRSSRQGGGLRGGRLLAVGAGGAQLLCPRRRQHAPPRTSRRSAPKRAMAAAIGGGRNPLLLYDDRAGAGGGFRPFDAEDDGAPRRRRQPRRLCHRRREMADHRRCRCGIRNHHGENRQRRPAGPPAPRCSCRRWTRLE